MLDLDPNINYTGVAREFLSNTFFISQEIDFQWNYNQEGNTWETRNQNDNWDYARGPIRQSGFQVAFGPVYSLYKNDLGSKTTEESSSTDIEENRAWSNFISQDYGVGITLNYERPLNLYWQLSLSNTLQIFERNGILDQGGYLTVYNPIQSNDPYPGTYETINYLNSLSARISYYPNTRTTMSAFNNFRYLRTHDKNNTEIDDAYESGLNNLTGIYIDYYLSPRMRLGGGISYSLNVNKTSEPHNYRLKSTYNNLHFHTTLTYKLL